MPGLVEKPKHRRDDLRVTMINRRSTWPDGARPSRFDRRLAESCRSRPCGGRRLRHGFGAWIVHATCMRCACLRGPRRRRLSRARSAPCPAPSTKVNASAPDAFGLRPTPVARTHSRPKSSSMRTMSSSSEVGAGLHLDDLDRDHPRIGEPVQAAERQVDQLVLAHEQHLVVARRPRRCRAPPPSARRGGGASAARASCPASPRSA